MSTAIQVPPVNTPLTDKNGQVNALWSRFFIASQQTITLDVAPADGPYLTTTANASLTNESNLGALSSGYVKVAVAAGVASPTTTATIPASDLSGSLPALDGSALTNLNASALATGTVAGARLPDPLPAISGANLTSLNATNLSSGTVPDARFPATLPASSGVNLTALNASQVTSGTLPDARFPATLPAASGVNLTALSASNLASGTVPQARLPFVLDAGTYTPTLTNVANLSASTAYVCQYLRVGSVVTVSGQVDVDPTTTLTDTQLGISLPVASNFAAAKQCAGTAAAPAIVGQCAAILADATNDRAVMEWNASDVTNQPMYFSFTYVVI